MTARSRSSRGGLVIAAVVALVGVVWIAQGLGAPIGGSFMIGDPFWAVAGGVLVAIGGVLAWRVLRPR